MVGQSRGETNEEGGWFLIFVVRSLEEKVRTVNVQISDRYREKY